MFRCPGDLGVQRGMLRWFISLHSPTYPVSVRRDKLVDQNTDTQLSGASSEATNQESSTSQSLVRAATPDESAPPPVPALPTPSAPKKKGKAKATDGSGPEVDTGMVLPPAFTPSINKTLNMLGSTDEMLFQPPPLPEGLTVAQMKTRLNGKNKIKYESLGQHARAPQSVSDTVVRMQGSAVDPQGNGDTRRELAAIPEPR